MKILNIILLLLLLLILYLLLDVKKYMINIAENCNNECNQIEKFTISAQQKKDYKTGSLFIKTDDKTGNLYITKSFLEKKNLEKIYNKKKQKFTIGGQGNGSINNNCNNDETCNNNLICKDNRNTVLFTNCILNPPTPGKKCYFPDNFTYESYKYNSSTYNCLTDVKDQEKCELCWCFSLLFIVEILWYINKIKTTGNVLPINNYNVSINKFIKCNDGFTCNPQNYREGQQSNTLFPHTNNLFITQRLSKQELQNKSFEEMADLINGNPDYTEAMKPIIFDHATAIYYNPDMSDEQKKQKISEFVYEPNFNCLNNTNSLSNCNSYFFQDDHNTSFDITSDWINCSQINTSESSNTYIRQISIEHEHHFIYREHNKKICSDIEMIQNLCPNEERETSPLYVVILSDPSSTTHHNTSADFTNYNQNSLEIIKFDKLDMLTFTGSTPGRLYLTTSSHAVTIIGYGVETDTEKNIRLQRIIPDMDEMYNNNLKYWIVQNSWGEDWGFNGRMKVIRYTEEMINKEMNMDCSDNDSYIYYIIQQIKPIYEEIMTLTNINDQSNIFNNNYDDNIILPYDCVQIPAQESNMNNSNIYFEIIKECLRVFGWDLFFGEYMYNEDVPDEISDNLDVSSTSDTRNADLLSYNLFPISLPPMQASESETHGFDGFNINNKIKIYFIKDDEDSPTPGVPDTINNWWYGDPTKLNMSDAQINSSTYYKNNENLPRYRDIPSFNTIKDNSQSAECHIFIRLKSRRENNPDRWLKIINMITGCLMINRFPEVIALGTHTSGH